MSGRRRSKHCDTKNKRPAASCCRALKNVIQIVLLLYKFVRQDLASLGSGNCICRRGRDNTEITAFILCFPIPIGVFQIVLQHHRCAAVRSDVHQKELYLYYRKHHCNDPNAGSNLAADTLGFTNCSVEISIANGMRLGIAADGCLRFDPAVFRLQKYLSNEHSSDSSDTL